MGQRRLQLKDIEAGPDGLKPVAPGALAEVVYKVQAANAIASQTIHTQFIRTDAAATATISVSLNHGTTWTTVAAIDSAAGGLVPVDVHLRNEVSGA